VNAEEIELGVPRRTDEAPEVRTGRIDRFDESRGFGFIQEDSTRERYFVHVSGMLEELREGDKVTFDLERGTRGLNAVGVKKA
jgi:cold shock CspA family protein